MSLGGKFYCFYTNFTALTPLLLEINEFMATLSIPYYILERRGSVLFFSTGSRISKHFNIKVTHIKKDLVHLLFAGFECNWPSF